MSTSKTARDRLGLSQVEFAQLLGVRRETVGRWESSEPDGAVLALLRMIVAAEPAWTKAVVAGLVPPAISTPAVPTLTAAVKSKQPQFPMPESPTTKRTTPGNYNPGFTAPKSVAVPVTDEVDGFSGVGPPPHVEAEESLRKWGI